MTFEQLRAFIAVAEQLSFTRAAELLYLSQPAVSQHIQGLERKFQMSLFERKGRKLELTQGGEKLLVYAQRIMREASEAENVLMDLNQQVHGKLQIGTSETIGSYLMPELIGRFSQRYPQVQVSLRFKSAREVVSALAHGELDMAVLEEPPGPKYRDQIAAHPYRTGQVVLIVSPDHPWATRSAVMAQELTETPLIVRQEADSTRIFWTERLAQAGIDADQLRLSFELDNTEGIKRAVMAGLGAGFVSTYAVAMELQMGLLKTVRLVGLDLSRSIWALVPSRYQLPQRVEAFLDFLLATASTSNR
jgi:DNA-binding transcriptional LysR family regulator